jgi:hypothetical protein
VTSLALLVFTSIFVVPGESYISPIMSTASLDPESSWLGILFRIEPSDRFDLGRSCGSQIRFCAAAPVPDEHDFYPNRILEDYRALMLEESR